VVTETNAVVATGGYDIVTSSANFTLSDNVEQLVLIGGATIGVGGATANYLYGGSSGLSLNLDGGGGDDVIYAGLAGGNTLVGGSGVDTLLIYGGDILANSANGGLGADIYYTYSVNDVLSEAGGDGIDTVYSSHNITLAAGFEQLLLFGSATTATGSGDNNIIYGNSTTGAVTLSGLGGADVLFGGAFNDSLLGGSGVDLLFGLGGTNTLVGGDDTDVYYIETATNTVTETLTGGFDTMYSNFAGTTTLAANVEQLILYNDATGGIGTLLGNDFLYANSVTVTGGVTLDGLGGNDYLLGSAFADILIGGLGNDQFELTSGGADKVRYNTSGNMGADTVYNFNAAGDDLIDLTGLGYNSGAIGGAITVTTFAGGTLISFVGVGPLVGTTINLVGVAVGNVTSADFAF
jgi:Ca2+-binding RTX toxin-like protein